MVAQRTIDTKESRVHITHPARASTLMPACGRWGSSHGAGGTTSEGVHGGPRKVENNFAENVSNDCLSCLRIPGVHKNRSADAPEPRKRGTNLVMLRGSRKTLRVLLFLLRFLRCGRLLSSLIFDRWKHGCIFSWVESLSLGSWFLICVGTSLTDGG